MSLTYTIRTPFFTKYAEELGVSCIVQGSILLLQLVLLNGPGSLRLARMSAVAYWCMVAIIMIRRNGRATKSDRFMLLWGFPLLYILTDEMVGLTSSGWWLR